MYSKSRAVSLSTLSIFFAVNPALAQVLEEVVVTAQRRVQSMQEVPISIEAVSGAEIDRQGFTDMDELANFSPTVLVNPDSLRPSITIRGFGAATADALTIEQSAPTFVDGIHYGRTSQIKLAFMDVERVEVLKGPQPVFFGQNAISGAFNITSRKPTPEWEGNVRASVDNQDSQVLELGVGGPLTPTLGIRLAGKYEDSEGYLEDAITGDSFPNYKNYGARVILQWNPTNRFEATAKFEASDMTKGAEGVHICATGNGTIPPFERAVWADPPIGLGWDTPHTPLGECFESNTGRNAGPYFDWPSEPLPGGIMKEEHDTFGLDIRQAANNHYMSNYGYGAESREEIKPWTTYLNLKYLLESGIEISSLTGYSDFYRNYLRDNSYSPFLANIQNREEDYKSLSQEIRVSSQTGGTFEWMVGAYYQDTDYDVFSDSLRNNSRKPRRYNEIWEKATWKSLFATVTYNFMGDKASVDVGGRWSDVDKVTHIEGWAATWVYANPAPRAVPAVTVDGQPGWTLPWRTRIRDVNDPTFIAYNGVSPIGLTALSPDPIRAKTDSPYTHPTRNKDFNPQVTLRYRPTDNISLYARWAESFKAGGGNTGQATIPKTIDKFAFKPEYAESFELGAKGTFLGGRVRGEVNLFDSETKDLQLSSSTPNVDNGLLELLNAGKQRVRGLEIHVDWAATDGLTLGLDGALMDGKMVVYEGANCTEAELNTAPESGCDPVTERIDRSGSQAPNTPDWKFALSADYSRPIWSNYLVNFNAMGFVSDGYFTDANGFSQVGRYNQHGDLNLQVGIGNQEETWRLSLYGKNILEARPDYNAEFDIDPQYFYSDDMYQSMFSQYGIKFQYWYN